MRYKNFESHITHKHGIVIEGWPLDTFKNPSSIGSQVELRVLLNSWRSGATYFRRMPDAEHMAWVKSQNKPSPDPSTDKHTAPVESPGEPSPNPLTDNHPGSTLQPPQQTIEELTSHHFGDPGPSSQQEPTPPNFSANAAGMTGMSFFQFELNAATTTAPGNAPSTSVPKRPRKTRSDKGRPRKKSSQTPGTNVFSL